jgi:uncharacterized Fe-S cluster-containing radical SAM superfamily protein
MQLPLVSLTHLDDLWFQVAGTRCNLACTHCFISCSPHNHSFGFLDLATVRRRLDEAATLGVKEYYFTGGEPFLNRDMVPILELTLQYGPATVLTNGTVLKDDWLRRLRAAEDASPYSLEFRVSMDGFTPTDNDAVRGEGTFERILAGVRMLLAHDFLPILTVTRTRVTPAMMEDYDPGLLVCSHSRMVTDRGVFVCPILIETPDARLGATLAESLRPFAIAHSACYTCWQHGALCANPSSMASGGA